MKQKTKSSSIIITLILLMLAVLCVTNVTYSYFTAQAKVEDETAFGDLNVRFVYQSTYGGSSIESPTGTIELFSSTGAIQQNVPFQFSLTQEGDPIYNLGIHNQSGSCDAYVRFWIDAFIVEDGEIKDNTNYGKYFFIADEQLLEEGVITRSGSSVQDSSCYFFPKVLEPSISSPRSIGTTLELRDVSATDTVPVAMLGVEMQITISFQAVQAANRAFESVFGAEGDTKGYYTGWGNA